MKQINSRISKLNDYLTLKLPKTSEQRWKKGSLAILAPLAASALMPSVAYGQCGMGNFDPTGGYNSDGALDVDGDGNVDFDFDVTSNDLYITAVGSMSVLRSGNLTYTYMSSGYTYVYSYSLIAFVNSNVSAAAAGDPPTHTWMGSGSDDFDMNPNTVSANGFLIIKDASGAMGFINLIFDASGSISVNMALTGVEAPNGGSDGFGVISTGDCETLPVELSNFVVQSDKSGSMLTWNTYSEINNNGFEIQRSTDGKIFHKVGWVLGEGNSTKEVSYKFVDRDIRANMTYYYRLKQMDFDGRSELSKVVTTKYEDRAALDIQSFAPNPIDQGLASLNITSGQAMNGRIELYNQSGQQLKAQDYVISVGPNDLSLDVSSIPNGTYFGKIILGDRVDYQKVFIIN